MKKLLCLLTAAVILFSPISITAKGSRSSSGKSTYKTPSYKSSTYKIPSYTAKSSYKPLKTPSYTTKSSYKPLKTTTLKTYKTKETKYDYSKTYKSSGLPQVKRSASTREQFLKSKGYTKVPAGYEVDHIIPLSKGGKDEPSNMELLTIEQHKQKTASEK